MENQETPPPSADFDLRRVAVFFRKSLRCDEGACIDNSGEEANDKEKAKPVHVDVGLADYVEAYNELNKMFPKLGRLFSFVASDVGDKTHILSEHGSSAIGEKYKSVGAMLEYEKNEAKILDHDKPHLLSIHHHNHHLANGSRTLLRLHRALQFVVEFIDGVRLAGNQDKMSHLARTAYDSTLAAHHPWLVRKGVHLAVHSLPYREQLLADLAGDVEADQAESAMEETVSAGRAVYKVIQTLYERHQLLDLP